MTNRTKKTSSSAYQHSGRFTSHPLGRQAYQHSGRFTCHLWGRQAFTLIELLVVMVIISIIITMVITVTKYVYDEAALKQTEANQNIVVSAIEAYYEVQGSYPADAMDFATPPGAQGPANADANNILLYYLRGWEEGTDNQSVRNSKQRVRKATESIILELPSDAVVIADLDTSFLMDGFGNAMQYSRTGGLGGRPVVVSAGPDDQFGTDDDIRSGEH